MLGAEGAQAHMELWGQMLRANLGNRVYLRPCLCNWHRKEAMKDSLKKWGLLNKATFQVTACKASVQACPISPGVLSPPVCCSGLEGCT